MPLTEGKSPRVPPDKVLPWGLDKEGNRCREIAYKGQWYIQYHNDDGPLEDVTQASKADHGM